MDAIGFIKLSFLGIYLAIISPLSSPGLWKSWLKTIEVFLFVVIIPIFYHLPSSGPSMDIKRFLIGLSSFHGNKCGDSFRLHCHATEYMVSWTLYQLCNVHNRYDPVTAGMPESMGKFSGRRATSFVVYIWFVLHTIDI